MNDKICYSVWFKNHLAPLDIWAHGMTTEGAFARFDIQYEVSAFYPINDILRIETIPFRENDKSSEGRLCRIDQE